VHKTELYIAVKGHIIKLEMCKRHTNSNLKLEVCQ